MNLVNWQQKLGLWQSWLLVGMIFSLPLHNEIITNLLLFVVLVFWLIEVDFARKWQQIKDSPLFYPILAYSVLYPLSLLWTDNIDWGLRLMEERHVIYWFFPLLITVVRREHIAYYLSAFVLAMTFSEVVSYAAWFQLFHFPGIDPADPAGFLGHWVYNPFLAFAVYLMGFELLFSKTSTLKKIVYAVFILTMTINMFITGGRIGQVAYFSLMFILLIQFFAMRQILWQGVATASVGLFTVFILAYSFSPLFHDRVSLGAYEVMHHDDSKTGSVNTRFIQWEYSWKLIQTQPFFGSGVGDYPDDYNKLAQGHIPETGMMGTFSKETGDLEGTRHMQPHNQYLYELASFGFFGFSIFVWIFVSLIKYAVHVKDEWVYLRVAFISLVLIISLTDSYLLVHQSFAYFFIFMLAIFWSHSDKVKAE